MSQTPCQKDRILIVDDDQAMCRALKRVLTLHFPKIMTSVATNGMEALKLFRADHHAIILMDVFMPLMNGEQTYRGLLQLCEKENLAMPAVVFCTGYNPSLEIRNFVKSAPGNAILSKPVKNEVLVEIIQSRLEGSGSVPQSSPDSAGKPASASAASTFNAQ